MFVCHALSMNDHFAMRFDNEKATFSAVHFLYIDFSFFSCSATKKLCLHMSDAASDQFKRHSIARAGEEFIFKGECLNFGSFRHHSFSFLVELLLQCSHTNYMSDNASNQISKVTEKHQRW